MALTLKNVLEKINGNLPVDLYRREKDVFYAISLHTKGARPSFKDPRLKDGGTIKPPFYFGEEYQKLFDTYLLSKHPRESAVTRDWRYSQYRALTKRPFLQLIEIITGAIFQDSQYTILLPNKKDQEYIYGNNFINGFDFIQAFQNYFAQSMIEDPNGYLVRLPKKPSYEITGDVEVDIIHVSTPDVIYQADGEDFIFYSKDKKFIYWINTTVILRFKVDPNNNKKYLLEDTRGYYAHLFGFLPVSKMGGIWNTEGFYNSFFDKAIPIADEFISTYSAEQMVDKEASHPFIQQAALDCPTCDGEGKIQRKCEISVQNPAGLELVICSNCNGKKQVSTNPADRYEVPIEDMDKDMVRIINPDVNINEYHRKKNADLMQGILDALNLLLIQQAQSGAAKALDQEKLYQFISNLSNHIFDSLIYASLRDIIGYRNVKSVNGVLLPDFSPFVLVKPSQFSIKTSGELLEEITGASTAAAPNFIRKKLVVEYVDKRFGGDDLFQKKTKIISSIDKAFIYTPAEKETLLRIGELTKKDLVISSNLPTVLDKMEEDKGKDFILNTSLKIITPLLIAELDKIEIPAETPPAVVV